MAPADSLGIIFSVVYDLGEYVLVRYSRLFSDILVENRDRDSQPH
mgnify:CR=1 FL=1